VTLTAIRPRKSKTTKAAVATEAKVFTVWGPLGSTGKSTLALNLAYEFALLGQRTILLDLDTYAPSLSQLLPVQESTSGLAGAGRLIRQGRFSPEELERLSINIKHGRTQFRLLPGLPNSNRWSELTPETVQQLLAVCNLNFDVIVIDVASNLEDALTAPESPTSRNTVTRTAIKLSSKVITVLTPTQLSISRYLNAYSELDELQKSRTLILNGDTANQQQLANAIRSLTKERIQAQIPRDEPALQLAESQRLPLALARRKSPARNAIAALAHKLLA
jgi:MinD-like ATPase involved in chromosome partitioning or flagellar assembly